MDENASNYNSEANVQAVDQYGNLQCVYASCDDIPEYGCIYADGFGAFAEVLACRMYTIWRDLIDGVAYFMDANATNYDADVQGYDQCRTTVCLCFM